MHPLKSVRGVAMLAMLLAVGMMVGSCCGKPPVKQSTSPIWSVEVTPMEDTNPTKTQHTFIATVRDQDGQPVPNVQVHWILARTGDAVGDIVAYDDQDLGGGTSKPLTRKTDNQYAVSYTNEQAVTIDRGFHWVADESAWTDFQVGLGQSWCTITSPVEGDSHMIAYVPAIEDGLRHKVFAIKHWQKVPHLVVKKDCPPTALLDHEFTYTITVLNDGEGDTPGPVMLNDMLPEGIVIVDGTTFPMDLGRMASGDSETITFRVRAQSDGVKVNMTEAQAGEFVARADCTTEVVAFDIDLAKECTGTYQPGDTIEFLTHVRNTRGALLKDVIVLDEMPPGVTYISADASVGTTSLSADGTVVTWQGFDLPAGGTASLNIKAKAGPLGVHGARASVSAGVHQSEAKVSADDSCQVEVIGIPKLEITKECSPAQLGIGDLATVTITVWNSGGGDATGVTVTDQVMDGFEAVGETSWFIDVLKPGRENARTLTLQARAMRAGTFTNVGTASAQGLQEVRDSCDVTVVGPTLTIRKECQAAVPVTSDISVVNRMDRATHTITVTNGDVKANDVVVVDNIPLDTTGDERLRYLSSNPEGVYDASSHTVTWNLGVMEAGQTTSLELTFEARDIGPAINTATVTARGFSGARDECKLFVLGSPAFQSALVDAANGQLDADNFVVNTPFYYVLAVQNEGDADIKLDLILTLSSELALDSTPLGFIPSLTSRGDPSGSDVLSVNKVGGTYQIQSFNLASREQRWIKIPVRGVAVTTTDAATARVAINWQLWHDGQLFPKKGSSIEEETTVIDPE